MDAIGLPALHADDVEFVIPGRTPGRGRNALRDLFEWDAVLGVELDMRDVSFEGDAIRVDTIIERGRFFEAHGVPEVRDRPGTRFVLRDGLIVAVRAADLDDETQGRVRPAYRCLLAWFSANRPDDLVTWMLPENLPHIGIVVARRSPDGNRPLVVHDVGAGPALEDVLFAYPITGHDRYEGPPRPSEGP